MLEDSLFDSEMDVEITSQHPVDVTLYDYETGKILRSGRNKKINSPDRLLLVKSGLALNQTKVLWLRDSFGTAMSPFMAATFSETLQINWDKIDAASLTKLVETYKPDYMFITAVERALDEKSILKQSFAKIPSITLRH